MAGFFSNLLDKITGIFKSKDLDSNIAEFQKRIDTIINDLITPYAQPTKLAPEDRFRDLITLLDPKKCNKIAITLSNNLDKNYTKLQLEQFASEVLVGRNQAECNDETCSSNATKNINNRKDKVSKKSICNSIAVHYVKMLNLIAAILTAVNPSDNICLNRLRNLLNTINEDEQTGVSSICDPSSNAVKDSIMLEPGFKELLMLYYYHLMQDTETEEEKTNVRNQYQNLVKTFSNLVMFVDPSLKEQGANNNSTRNQNIAERNELISAASSSRTNQNLTGNNTNKNKNKNNNNTSLLENTLENIDAENKSVLEEPISQVSQANLNTVKNEISSEISSKISNLKAAEQQQINTIVQKLENLNRNIANIKEQSKQSQSVAPIPEPTMNQTTMNQPAPTMNQPAPAMNQAAPAGDELTDAEIDSLLSELSQPESSTPAESSQDSVSAPAESSNISSNTTMTTQPVSNQSGNTTTTQTISNQSGNTTSNNTTEEINNILESYERSSKRSGNTSRTQNNSNYSSGNSNNSGNNNNNSNNTNNTNTTRTNTTTTSGTNTTRTNTTATTPAIPTAPAQAGGADNQNNMKKNKNNKNTNTNNNNNNNESLVGNEQNNVGNIVNSDIKNSTPENIRLKEFKDFVAYYVKMNVIDDKVLDMVNTAFKQSGNFARDSPNEGSMYISDKDFEDFCVANINNNALIPIKISDSNLGEFIKIYKDMKESYLDNCNYLLSLLEKQILDTIKESQGENKAEEENPRFTLKNIGFSDLVSIEVDVRNRLVSMYSTCHENYQKGVKSLYDALRNRSE